MTAQGGVLGIRRGTPSDHRLGLRIGHRAAIFGVPIFRTDFSPLQERQACRLAGGRFRKE